VRAVQARGGVVHWAESAEEAVWRVVRIARDHGVRRIVKSKSMLSEEVGLNDGLEAEGLHVVETDLGEFVVQLAADRPSHIIAPIVHWSRERVAALFERRLGVSPDETRDVPSLCAVARRVLREEFLAADMGVSGVNFGVAETGTLCLVTNEGNGRMCTSLPRVHVALMGIERVVPTQDDLAIMMQVLARSATGQKLSVYTSLVTGPRRHGEDDGPEALHVVLVDNGRSRVLGSRFAEALYCIRCGACLNACPVYRDIGGHAYGSVYAGPIGAVLTPALDGQEAWHALPHASTLCGACREVCPVRIDIPRLLLELRREGVARGHAAPWMRVAMRLHGWLAMRPAAYRRALGLVRLALRPLVRDGWIARLPWPLAGWTTSRDFPSPAPRSFTERWQARERRP
jgi:L-lactate dehydrogenase complex protein LldF